MHSIKAQQKRNTFKEVLFILVKFFFCIVLLFLHVNQPNFYKLVPVFQKIGYSLLIFLTASISVSILRLIVISIYIKRNKLVNTIKDNFILGINQIVSVLNTLFIIISLMILLGIDPIKFLTSITIVAAAIALISKEYITNMINGLIIMFSDRLSLGDHIKIGNEEGKILDITLLNIVIQNEDNDTVLIPNGMIFTSLIINHSKQNIKKVTLEFETDLSHGFTPANLEDKLSPILIKYADLIVENGFSIKTLEIKKDTVKFKINVILKYPEKKRETEMRRNINSEILTLVKR